MIFLVFLASLLVLERALRHQNESRPAITKEPAAPESTTEGLLALGRAVGESGSQPAPETPIAAAKTSKY